MKTRISLYDLLIKNDVLVLEQRLKRIIETNLFDSRTEFVKIYIQTCIDVIHEKRIDLIDEKKLDTDYDR